MWARARVITLNALSTARSLPTQAKKEKQNIKKAPRLLRQNTIVLMD